MAIQSPPRIDDLEGLRARAKEAVDTAVDYLIRIDNLLVRINGESAALEQVVQALGANKIL